MNHVYFFVTCFLMVGCASSQKNEIKSPATVKEEKIILVVEKDSSDTDSKKICETVVDGTKWTYNKTKDIWERISSEENSSKLKKAWDKTKKVTTEAWEAGKKAYEEKK